MGNVTVLGKKHANDLGTVILAPERGVGGDPRYPGNHAPNFQAPVLKFFRDEARRQGMRGFRVMDPCAGSGTTGDVCSALGIEADLYDLRPNPPWQGQGSFNMLRDEPVRRAHFIWAHWPYWNMYRYQQLLGHNNPGDLSMIEDWDDFLSQSGRALARLIQFVEPGGWLAVLVGTMRREGVTYDMALELPKPCRVAHRIIKGQFNESSACRSYGGRPLLRIAHEDLLIFRRHDAYVFTAMIPVKKSWDLRNSASLTWRGAVIAALYHLGGRASLKRLYREMEPFKITKENRHPDERIRATLQEGEGRDFFRIAPGVWGLIEAGVGLKESA